MLEGFGSRSVPLTNAPGSGFRRPKNIPDPDTQHWFFGMFFFFWFLQVDTRGIYGGSPAEVHIFLYKH
jgi:hypothetical protein